MVATDARRRNVIERCWDLYVGHIVRRAKPNEIVVIGKGVGKTLEDRLNAVTGGGHIVLPQPQARLTAEEHLEIHRRYREICARFRR